MLWARKQFQEKFSNSIAQLLHNFPKDQIDTEGNRFWSGHKRAPDPIVFDVKDSLHMNFIVAAANLFAETYVLISIVSFDSSSLISILKQIRTQRIKRFGVLSKLSLEDSVEKVCSS